jgi:ferredoxin-NADP reductase
MFMYTEGFYGHYEDTKPYKKQVLVAGGIGVTHCLPYFVQSIRQDRCTHLIWIMRDIALAAVALESITRAIKESSGAGVGEETGQARVVLTIVLTDSTSSQTTTLTSLPMRQLHHEALSSSGQSSPAQEFTEKKMVDEEKEAAVMEEETASSVQEALYALPSSRITVNVLPLGRRPNVKELLQDTLVDHQEKDNVMMICCGPNELCDATRNLARQNDIAYFEEPFGW